MGTLFCRTHHIIRNKIKFFSGKSNEHNYAKSGKRSEDGVEKMRWRKEWKSALTSNPKNNKLKISKRKNGPKCDTIQWNGMSWDTIQICIYSEKWDTTRHSPYHLLCFCLFWLLLTCLCCFLVSFSHSFHSFSHLAIRLWVNGAYAIKCFGRCLYVCHSKSYAIIKKSNKIHKSLSKRTAKA